MWLWLADTSGTTVVVPLTAAVIAATGTMAGSWLVIRNNKGEQAAKKRADKPRRHVTHSDRLTRMESWREQYADPLLHRLQNVLEWDDPKDGRPRE